MGRAHHDGQELEHLPRGGSERSSRANAAREKKTRACLFGFGKYMRVESSVPPLSLSPSALLLGLLYPAGDTPPTTTTDADFSVRAHLGLLGRSPCTCDR